MTDYETREHPPHKKRKLNDRSSEEPWDNPYAYHDPITKGIIEEAQARELFRM
jgi:hypothetical protein